MGMVFYGAGKWGRDALDIYLNLYKEKQDKEVLKGFADRVRSEDYCGYPMISVSEIRERGLQTVITVGNPHIATDIYHMLRQNGIKHIYWFVNIERKNDKNEKKDFLQEECIDCSNWGDSVLPRVEMHIADHCNLNCRGCTHYAPIFGKELPDFTSRIQDVKMLKEKVSHIVCFSILGGEPFLNPDIALYITEIRKILPDTYIQIVTNGLLIPQLHRELLECIVKNRVVVKISEYQPTHQMIDRIEKTLKEYKITYYVQRYEEKQKFIKPLSLAEKSSYPHKCISEGCVNIWNGKIAKCPTLLYLERFNHEFGQKLPDEGIMQLKDCPEGSELLDALSREVPLCKHCICYEMEWGQCGAKPKVEDFAADV